MLAYTLKRLLSFIPLLLGISFMVFFLMSLAPGDFLNDLRAAPDMDEEVIRQMEVDFGLDKPWYQQYGLWLKNVLTLNFGESWSYKIPVLDLLVQRVPATVILALSSFLFAWSIAIPLGVLAAIYKDSIFDRISAFLAYSFLSIPEFFLAILAVYFAATTGFFPTGGRSSIEHDFLPLGAQLVDYAKHLILPTIVLGIGNVASLMRVMRANFLDYLRADFVRTARAKGLPAGRVMFFHVLRNAINPLLTYLGFAFSSLLSGSLLVEKVMNYPGLGTLTFDAFMRKDQYVVIAAVLIGSLMLMLGNFLADLLLAKSDPRIRLEKDSSPSSFVEARKQWLWIAIIAGFVCLLSYGISLLPWQDKDFLAQLVSFIKIGGSLLFASVFLFLLIQSFSLFKKFFAALFKQPFSLCAFICLALLYVSALFAPFIAPSSANKPNLKKTFHPPTALTWTSEGLSVKKYHLVDPSSAKYEVIPGEAVKLDFFARGEPYKLWGFIESDLHLVLPHVPEGEDPAAHPLFLMGSDATGRDVFSRLLFGSQISLSIGLIGISITFFLGFLVGGLAGFFGGKIDFVAMRLVELLMAVPGLYLLLALRAALAPHFESAQMYTVIIVVLSLIGWAGAGRVIRGLSLSLRGRTYVMAAESMGQSVPKILFKHFLPNLSSYLLVAATLSIPGYILGEASLSFLGLGIQEPSASWGLMLAQAQGDMKVLMLNMWWLLSPGFMIFMTVVCFNVLGDTLRDVVDPSMKTNR